MGYSIDFELKGLPRMSNPSGKSSHWRAIDDDRKCWQSSVVAVVGRNRPPKPLTRVKLTLTRFSSTEPDYDGLVRGFKSVVDGLKMARVIEDDKLSNTGTWDCAWVQVLPKRGRIRVIVEEGDNAGL